MAAYEKRPRARRRSPRVLSLFSGAGGLDLGFIQAGFVPVGAYDICPAAVAAYRSNICADAHVLDLSDSAPDPDGVPDVVVAGAPCQGHSTIGARRLNDPRNALFPRAAKLAVRLSPQAIVLENVPGLLAGRHRGYYDAAAELLREAGYAVRHVGLAAEAAGLPQRRKRIFLVGTHSDRPLAVRAGPAAPSLGQAIANCDGLPNHEPRLLRPGTDAHRIASAIAPGQKLCDVRAGPASVHSWDIPGVFGATTRSERRLLVEVMRLRRRLRRRPNGDADPVQAPELGKRLGAGFLGDAHALVGKGYLVRSGDCIDLSRRFNGKFRRLDAEGLSNAVDTRFGDPRCFLHPVEQRGLSVREAARIQGLPDGFILAGSLAEQFRMVGNAVPPPMAKAVALAVLQTLR